MDYNSWLIIIGSIIVLVGLFVSIKGSSKSNDEMFIETPVIKEVNQNDTASHLEHQEIYYQLQNVDLELKDIKKEVKNLFHLMELHTVKSQLSSLPNKDATPSGHSESGRIIEDKQNIQEGNFNNLLNYNMFTKKNSDIIELYKSGISVEEIAKKLNKSIREVEMVIKLVK